MADTPNKLPSFPGASSSVSGVEWDKILTLATDAVNLAGLLSPLPSFLQELGNVHTWLFGTKLVVTSGNDGQHAPGSKHGHNKAVDLRTRDKSPEGLVMFLVVALWAARSWNLAFFDESNSSKPHVHVEIPD